VNAHRRTTWTWFVGTALLLLGVVSWLTAMLAKLDGDEIRSRQDAELQQRLRLALWRMDSWLSPHLAREAMRPASEYRAFAAPGAAWTRGLEPIARDDLVVPSPLLSFASDLFPLHFELASDGSLQSPQVPTGNQRGIAEANGVMAASIDGAASRLAALQAVVQQRLLFAGFDRQLQQAEALLPVVGCTIAPPGAGVELQQSVADYGNRQRANAQNLGQGGTATTKLGAVVPTAIGPLLPLWLDGPEPMLVFARRASEGGVHRLQGVVVDWPTLQRELLALVGDLFAPGAAELVRCAAPTPVEQGSMLASVPARLEATPYLCHVESKLPTSAILGITWGITVLALLVLGFTLRAAIGFGERRARFASAVTHELRTPLTTFRMYSEMLADGVVTEPAAQREYLDTLRREADRLSRVVENVLAWSRLEQGRFASRRERHGVASLLQRIAPSLQRRLADAGMALQLDVDPSAADAVVTTDDDAVAQILFNLVDNAAKYARDSADRTVHLAAHLAGGTVQLDVRDHGPGIAAPMRARVFAPFDRGAVPTASNDVPGVGLGLALARGLARDLGGDLTLVDAAAPGACFRLALPGA